MKQLRDYRLFNLTEGERLWLESHSIYIGDIHNHAGISYGYGTMEKAINFARQQLDFFTVTGHFAWPDMETAEGMEIPADVVAYHKAGFAKLRRNWPEYLVKMQNAETDSFIPFPSWEFHSFHYGDYTVVAKHQGTPLPVDPDEGVFDTRLQKLIEENHPEETDVIAFPHHIGYKEGYRGINWSEFNEDTSRVVEIASMHGCAESHDARLQYCHTMGPRSEKNTMQGGLERGCHFGVLANTDHHNASPGSYGFGRSGVYSESLSRDGIWNNIIDRRTLAYTGDPVRMAIFADGKPLGTILNGDKAAIDAYAVGFDEIDRFELIHDGKIVAEGMNPETDAEGGFVSVAFGWGKKNSPCYWTVNAWVEDNEIVDSISRYRGKDMVDPLDVPKQDEEERISFTFRDGKVEAIAPTDGNKTAVTNSAQGFVMELAAGKGTLHLDVTATWRGEEIERHFSYDIASLTEQKTEYINGFVSPALAVGRFVPVEKASSEIHFEATEKGYYYVRAYEKNNDGAYSTPIWIE